jgi:hypothetical protein
LTSWLRIKRRPRVPSAVGTRFRPRRWPADDQIIAIAAVVLAVTPFTPWFKATVGTPDPNVTGILIDLPGTVSGIGAHQYLWGVFALALLQFGLIAVRHAPDRRVARVPGYRWLLVVTCGLSLIVVGVGCALKPGPWYGNLAFPPPFSIQIKWDVGAIVALGAALVGTGAAIAALRDQTRQ